MPGVLVYASKDISLHIFLKTSIVLSSVTTELCLSDILRVFLITAIFKFCL